MPINIFVSVGRPFNDAQEEFVAALEAHLRDKGFRPRTVGRNTFTHARPLQLVDELMDRCAGVIVIALERLTIEHATDRRGSSQESRLENLVVATPWNQIEAAIAYAKGLPLLVIKDSRVREEGLLEKGYDWYVHNTAIDLNFLDSPEFTGTFGSWLRDARKRAGWFACRKE